MKKDYISAITNLLHDCDDLEMLEIILQLLQKSNQHLVDAPNLA